MRYDASSETHAQTTKASPQTRWRKDTRAACVIPAGTPMRRGGLARSSKGATLKAEKDRPDGKEPAPHSKSEQKESRPGVRPGRGQKIVLRTPTMARVG